MEAIKDADQLSEKTEPKQLTPREALERIHAARVKLFKPLLKALHCIP